jgi:hypothetical protein
MIAKLKHWIGINPLKWVQNTLLMRRRVEEFILSGGSESGPQHIGVVITPWLGTSIPWYSLAIGLMLSKAGSRVTFVIDDQPFGRNRLRYYFVSACIRFVIQPMRTRFRVAALSTTRCPRSISAESKEYLKQLARLNATWELRGEMDGRGRGGFELLCEQQFIRAYPAIDEIVSSSAFDLLFIPGGVWGTSGIWSKVAREAGIRVGSYDAGGYRTVMLAGNGIACQLQDIPLAFQSLLESMHDERSMAFARGEALAEMQRRKGGIDAFESQIQGSGSGDSRYDQSIMLALNSSWDSAALGLHAIFKDNSDWIVQTVQYLLDQTESTVVVRQHPAERLDIAKTSDNYRMLLDRHFGTHPRLHFIEASDKINSYDLMSRVRAVVVYTSTIGIEAVANSIPVITASNSYYSELGFVYKAGDVHAYRDLLKRAVSGELSVSEGMKTRALIGFYLTQCCNWIFTDFNPSDFHVWSRQSLDRWYQDKNIQIILETLQRGLPVATINHRIKYLSSKADV